MEVSGDEMALEAKTVPFGKLSCNVPVALRTSSVLILHLISKFSPICGLSGIPIISVSADNAASRLRKRDHPII